MKRDMNYHKQRAAEFVAGLSFEEKLGIIAGCKPLIKKFGLEHLGFNGEAAHGVQARHDQSFDLGEPVNTTIFPNPVGMASSFDKEMMHAIGEVVGTEMRSLMNEGLNGTLCGFAPTVDMERDPRWGRNEEGYGEDPHLASRMAGEYILGMAGEDETYVRAGATLKHFYANNVEYNRFKSDSRMPLDLKEDYYIRVFKEIIEYAKPLSVMTSYNLVNGVPSTFCSEINELLRPWGVTYIVSDAFTLGYAVTDQKKAEDAADAVIKGLTAGIDLFMEKPEFLDAAMKKLMSTGALKEEAIDSILINKLTVYSVLGMMNEDIGEDGLSKAFPISEYNISKVDTPSSRALSRKAAAEGTVLLKNDGMLPLITEGYEEESVFAFGPFYDRCPLDWYSGISSHFVTFKEGMNSPGNPLYPKVRIVLKDDRFVRDCCSDMKDQGAAEASDTMQDNTSENAKMYAGLKNNEVVAVGREEAEIFEIMLWDDSRFTLRSTSTGLLLTTIPPDSKVVNIEEAVLDYKLYIAAGEAFSWFVNEAFQMIDDRGEVISFNEENALSFWTDSRIEGFVNFDGTVKASFETVADVPELIRLSVDEYGLGADTSIIMCAGLHPIVNCKEERDRTSIELPPFQRASLRLLRESFNNIILIIMANAPVAVEEEDKADQIRAILWSAFGSEEFGNGLSDIITGRLSPAGRLCQTWYRNDSQLADIEDYDIRRNGMTYIYMTDKPLYRFGYGLSYSEFECKLMEMNVESIKSDTEAIDKHFIEATDKPLKEAADKHFNVSIKNTGDRISDYVVQIYKSPEDRYYLYGNDRYGKDVYGSVIPVGSVLTAFERVHDIKPGEEVIVTI